MNLVRYVALGILFTAPVELFNQVMMQKAGLRGFLTTCASYAVILSLWFFVLRRLEKRQWSRSRLALFNYAAFAVIGLMVEWFLIGNSPWANPAANQIGMLGWWGLLAVFPYIVSDRRMETKRIRKWTWSYWAVIGIASLAIPLATGQSEAGFFLGLLAVHYGLTFAHIFAVWHVRAARFRP